MAISTRAARAAAAAVIAGLALATIVGPVSAASPKPVVIVSTITFNDPGPNTGDFTVDGGGGLMCQHGSVVDTRYVFAGYQSNRRIQILVDKDFICDDGRPPMHRHRSVQVMWSTSCWATSRSGPDLCAPPGPCAASHSCSSAGHTFHP